MKTLPPCDHDEFPLTQCNRTEAAEADSVKRMVSWLAWINHKLDMLAYRIWWWRWKKKFVRQPEMLIPFMDTMTRWAEKNLTPDEIEACRKDWRRISQKPANDPSSGTPDVRREPR